MIDKRLVAAVRGSKKYIAGNVILQWCSLAANIMMMYVISSLLGELFEDKADFSSVMSALAVVLAAVVIRFAATAAASHMSYLSSKEVKKTLREKIYLKLLKLGASYREQVKTSEVVQMAVEGVDQLETYFGAYLPQFFYAMIAPLTLFVCICFVNVPAAVVLLVCVPLIPVAIVAVQKWAKKLLSKYWGQYTALGDTFLENLQGLTTLKIYQADEFKNVQMNTEAEKFRKITMKVLTMQLNSITIMDLIAYGGAALGIIMAAVQYRGGKVTLEGCILIILLAADFFIPMRRLGSFFHIAMNGMAASDKIFRLLDLPEKKTDGEEYSGGDICCRNLSFSYDGERTILNDVNLSINIGSFTAIAGGSGCGKSTIASILTGKNKNYGGSVTVGKTSLNKISEQSLMKNITYVNHQSYLFKGTVKDNLLMGKPSASDAELWAVLERVKFADFLKSENGLETAVSENGSNLSGGQRQRLGLARALLHDSPVYIFDEATSNIDVESENDIMKEILRLSENKTVIVISHRLANIVRADKIYVMENGSVAEEGTHEELVSNNSVYAKLWNTQQSLENYGKAGGAA